MSPYSLTLDLPLLERDFWDVPHMDLPLQDPANSRGNGSTPIARLPPEILAKIFKHAIDLEETYFSSGSLHLGRFSKVCRHWHSVVADFPMLWSSLVFTDVVLTAEMLCRSKASPLVVKVKLANYNLGLVTVTLSQLFRIRVLHIMGPPEWLTVLFTAMERPAPLLQSLCFKLINATPLRRQTIPLSLFASVTPCLHRLAVRDVDVPWNSPLLNNLSHLEICDSIIKPRLTDLLDVLSRCPALVILILSKNLPVAHEEQYHSRAPVPLPRLEHLLLGGCISDCNSVLHTISFLRPHLSCCIAQSA
jgi:hypothetical protein